MVDVTIEAPVRPTEDQELVAKAVLQIFPDARLDVTREWVRGRASSIDMMLKKTTEERVRDAARGTLWRGRIDERSTRFELSKQAACVGRINFNEVTHPLGDLQVTVVTDSLAGLLDHIAPPTRAEIAAMEKRANAAAARAELHGEEQALTAIGTAIDQGLDELDRELDEEAEAILDGAAEATEPSMGASDDEDHDSKDDDADGDERVARRRETGDGA